MNEEKTIGKLTDNLKADPFPKEIIVVDGGSSDNTVDIARSKGARVIKEKGEKSLPNAKNQGAKESKFDVICFLEGDMEYVNENFFTDIMRHFTEDGVVGVKFQGLPIERTITEKVIGACRQIGIAKYVREKQLTAAWPRFLRKDFFKEIGGFSLLGYGEDVAFQKKIDEYLKKNSSKKIKSEQNSKAFGRGVKSFHELFKQRLWYGRTILPYLREVDWGMWELISLVTLPAYIISIISAFLILLSLWFLIPAILYFVKSFMSVFESIRHKNRYCLLIPLVDLIGGTGFIAGLLQYLVGKKSLSRG